MAKKTISNSFTVNTVENGENSIRLDLNNEGDTMLYDGAGNLLSGSVSTTASLYDGSNDVSANATFSILGYSGMNSTKVSISGRTVTVSGMTSDSGYVDIRASYNGNYYAHRFTLKKIVGVDKFDLVVSPNAVSINTSDTTFADTPISVQVYRTPSNGGARQLVSWTKENGAYHAYGLTLVVKDGLNNTLTETTSGTPVNTRIFNLTGTMATNTDMVSVTLSKSSVVQDVETIPVSHVRNGQDGTGANAVRIDLDNDMDSIPCDADGKTLAAINLAAIARIYDGATPVTSGISIDNIETLAGIQAVTDTTTPGVIAIIWPIPANTVFSAGRYTAQIRLSYNGNLYYVTFVATVVRSGESGVSPEILSLLPTPNQISFPKDSSGVIPTSSKTLSLKIKKTIGNTTEVKDVDQSGLTIRYSTEAMPATVSDGTAWSGDISIPSTATYSNVYIAAFNGSTLVDRETVPIIKDGVDGVDYIIQTSTESVKIPSDETSVSKSITFRFYSKTGESDKQAFTTYYSIYYRGTSGFYTLVYPPTSFARSSYTYTFSNIGTSVSAIVVYIWGNTDYRGQSPEGQPYLAKKEIPIIKDGDTGQAGERGKVGRFYYYSGFDWDASNVDDTFVVNDAQVPYFSKAGSNANKYYVFNPETIPASGEMTMAQMAAETSVGGQIQWNEAPWEVMTDDFKYLITKAIFAQFAQFGSAIISEDWMLSTNGTINGVAYNNGASYNNSPAYTWFDPQYPNESVNTTHNVNGKTWTGYNFVPNYAVDLLTGSTYQHDTHITGGIFVDKVSKVICNTYIWGNNNQWVGTDFNYYLYNATEGEHIYDCDHQGVHRDYYSVGKITLKSNFFFILASGIRDKDASATSGSLHIKLPNPKYFIGQSIVITNKSTGFPPNSLLLEQEYVRKNGSGPRHDGQGGSSEHYICTTAKELLLDYPNSQGLGEDGEPVLSNGTYTIIEDDNFTKEYNPTQTGLYSINGIYIANTNIDRPTILTELDLNEYEWIELVAVEWNIESQSNILPAIVNEHFSDFYTQWMVTRWEKKATS